MSRLMFQLFVVVAAFAAAFVVAQLIISLFKTT
jgi:hypothetical protein